MIRIVKYFLKKLLEISINLFLQKVAKTEQSDAIYWMHYITKALINLQFLNNMWETQWRSY